MNNESLPPPKASLPVIACEISALTEDQRRRREALERLCCSFLSFATRIDSVNDRLIQKEAP